MKGYLFRLLNHEELTRDEMTLASPTQSIPMNRLPPCSPVCR